MKNSLAQTFPFIYIRSEREKAASERLNHLIFLVNTSSDPLFLSYVDFYCRSLRLYSHSKPTLFLVLGLFGPFTPIPYCDLSQSFWLFCQYS